MNQLGLGRSEFFWVSILACLIGMVSRQRDATPVSASVSPTSTIVSPDGSKRFTAAVSGTMNTAVSWKIGSGRAEAFRRLAFTPPSRTATATILATSMADTIKSQGATVGVTAPNCFQCRSISQLSN